MRPHWRQPPSEARRLRRALTALDDAPVPTLGPFRSVFRWTNTILGSFIAALGIGEALKELKETTENAYEDAAQRI